MKKFLFISAFMASLSTVQGQEAETSLIRKNDVMLGPIELIAGPILNISYERLLSENSGVGVNALFDLQKNQNSAISQISPYYRMYFGKKYASGFFVEGFVPITKTKNTYVDYNGYPYYVPSRNEDKTTVGIGVGFGGKWVARKNIIFEASTGIGRRFGLDKTYDTAITGKGMLGIGYRF